jgi:hypothetical protein
MLCILLTERVKKESSRGLFQNYISEVAWRNWKPQFKTGIPRYEPGVLTTQRPDVFTNQNDAALSRYSGGDCLHSSRAIVCNEQVWKGVRSGEH